MLKHTSSACIKMKKFLYSAHLTALHTISTVIIYALLTTWPTLKSVRVVQSALMAALANHGFVLMVNFDLHNLIILLSKTFV